MAKVAEYLNQNKSGIIKAAVFLLVLAFIIIKQCDDFKRKGVYTIAEVIRSEGAAEGKIMRDRPFKVIFYRDKPVTDCILKMPLPPEGWKEIPVCG